MLVGGFVASGLLGAATGLVDRPPPVDALQELVARDVSVDTLVSVGEISDWRAAIAACGLKPSTYKSSPEQLARRLFKSGPLHTPLPLVDVYCDVATRWLAPLGAYDVTSLPSGAIELRLARPDGDVFHPLGAKDGEMPLTPQVAVYADGPTVICWAYNCRDSRGTCLQPGTDVGLFIGEAVTERQQQPLREALSDLAGRLSGAGASVGPAAFASAGSESGSAAVEVAAP
ncbi:MAG: phenylalanine--tRNA ligase beta subunit-related protein [Acidimicrobiales bacterium]